MKLRKESERLVRQRACVLGLRSPSLDEVEGYKIEQVIPYSSTDITCYEIIVILTGVFFSIQDTEKRISEVIRREKEIFNALDRGSHVCLLLFNPDDPLFLRLLERLSLGFAREAAPRTDIKVKRSEFTTFLNKYGTALSVFDGDFASRICVIEGHKPQTSVVYSGEYVTGFTIKSGKGLITILPFFISEPQQLNNEIVKDIIQSLIVALLSHRMNLTYEPPDWVSEIRLKKELEVQKEISELMEKIREKQPVLDEFMDLKSVLWFKHDELRDKCMDILSQIGIKTMKDDIGEEDFWILDGANIVAMCEVKGKDHNIERTDLSKLDEHRAARNKPDDFPALLIVNSFNKAKTFAEKDIAISSNEIKKAMQLNMLIVRTLDLVRLLDLAQQQQVSSDEILKIITNEHGWMKVTDRIEIVQK